MKLDSLTLAASRVAAPQRPAPRGTLNPYAFLTCAFVAATFLIDLQAPLGFSLWGPYLLAVWCSARWHGGATIAGTAVVCCLLTLVGLLPEMAQPGWPGSAFDRGVGVAVLSASAVVVWRRQVYTADLAREVAERRHAEELLRERTSQLEGERQMALTAAQDADDARRRTERGEEMLAGLNTDLQREFTERKQAEELFRTLLESAPDAMVIADAAGNVILTNRQSERLFGYPAVEMLGQPVEQFLPDYDRFKDGPGGELHGRRKDGSAFPAEIRLGPLQTSRGPLVSAAVRDVSERRQVERMLRDSQERTRRILDTASSAFVAIDAQGRVTEWNAQAAATFGWSRQEALGRPVDELILPERYRAEHRRGLFRYLAVGQGQVRTRRMQVEALNRTGCEFPVEMVIWPTRVGDTWNFNAFIEDITERKQAEQRLRELNDMLERRVAERTAAVVAQSQELRHLNEALVRSNQDLDDFASIASHDLKEPLRGIANYTRFLIEDHGPNLEPDAISKLETLERLSRHMFGLIDSLLEYSRVGRVDLAIAETDLQTILGRVLDSLRIMLEEQRVEVVVPEPLPTVRCDRARVGEIFRNLLTNAVKYNDSAAKRVEVGFRKADGAAPIFFVRDNGIGIPDKHRETIFRFLKRLHPRDRYGGGSGAGLTIVKKIVERHGGRVWVESALGEGSTFYFTLQPDGESVARGPSSVVKD